MKSGLPVGIPFGSIARMILLYLQTEAVKTRSREIELGRSMNQWLSSMNIDGGGRQYRLVREQSRRLSLCRLTFYRTMDEATHVTNSSFVRDAILPARATDQLPLWREVVRLDEGFYESLIAHPMPVLESAIKQIGSRSMAIDVYVWLAYRLHHLAKPTPVSWRAVYEQFGGGYAQFRQFKAKFREPLALALAAYPEARVSADDDGLTLFPSAPPVPGRKAIGSLHRLPPPEQQVRAPRHPPPASGSWRDAGDPDQEQPQGATLRQQAPLPPAFTHRVLHWSSQGTAAYCHPV